MASYKLLSILQGLVIFVCGWSVFESGVGTDADPFPILNDLLFSDGGSNYWNNFAFWGYCFIFVAILQFIKALSADEY